MDKITYKTFIKVYLGGRFIGTIKQEWTFGRYIYYPKGQTKGGVSFSTLKACKESVEES